MTCTRCHGLLLPEPVYRRFNWWWKCLNCGDRVDGVILRHRAEQDAMLAERQLAQERDLKEWAAWFARIPVAGSVEF